MSALSRKKLIKPRKKFSDINRNLVSNTIDTAESRCNLRFYMGRQIIDLIKQKESFREVPFLCGQFLPPLKVGHDGVLLLHKRLYLSLQSIDTSD